MSNQSVAPHGADAGHLSPAMAAQMDWISEGQFTPERYQGEQRKQYEEARKRIERQWDNQP